jgi:hypothetical protein
MALLRFKYKPLLRRIFSLFVITAFIVGCAGQQRLKYREPYVSPETAWNIIKASAVSTAITAIAKIDIADQDTRYLFKAAVMMKRPDSLRLELMPLIGSPDLFISMENGEMRIFIPSKKRFYQGRTTARNISRFLHVYIDGNELISLMMGLPPYHENQRQNLTGALEEKLYRMDLHRDDGGILSCWIDPLANRIIKISLVQQDKGKFYEAIFDKYTTVEGQAMPQSLTIAGDKSPTLKITYHDVQEIPDDQATFMLQIPDGIIPTLLD